jgi:NhaP-type Na+/H+ or K+/H+ antiporter
MDDKKVFELKRLELAYKKQLLFMIGNMVITLLGLVLYIINIYSYHLQLLLVAIMLVIVGTICVFDTDSKLKEISHKIKGL